VIFSQDIVLSAEAIYMDTDRPQCLFPFHNNVALLANLAEYFHAEKEKL
jgi:hypothetical protein